MDPFYLRSCLVWFGFLRSYYVTQAGLELVILLLPL
jgi:hypothetical protein